MGLTANIGLRGVMLVIHRSPLFLAADRRGGSQFGMRQPTYRRSPDDCSDPVSSDREASTGRRYSGVQTTKGRSAFDLPQGFRTVAKPELGTKRLCASCGAKFYDLNHDPITCPKCGAVHEVAPVPQRGGRPDVPARPVAQEAELPDTQEAEFISLEEADVEAQGKQPGEEIPDVGEEVEMDESLDAAAFIAETEAEDADVPEIRGSDIEDEEET
jgi:uncharacterized protein (TIGR02300 family)